MPKKRQQIAVSVVVNCVQLSFDVFAHLRQNMDSVVKKDWIGFPRRAKKKKEAGYVKTDFLETFD